jgi:hypothetical protein
MCNYIYSYTGFCTPAAAIPSHQGSFSAPDEPQAMYH